MTLAKEKSLLTANLPECVPDGGLHAFYAPLISYCAMLCGLRECERDKAVFETLAELAEHQRVYQKLSASSLRRLICRRLFAFLRDESECLLPDGVEWENFLHEYRCKHRFYTAVEKLKYLVPSEIFVAFEMFVIHKRSAKDTADFLDLGVTAVYSAKSRCITLLKELTGEAEVAPDTPHYTREELDMFRHNQLSSFSAFNCSAHLSICKECSKIMEELADDDCFIADLCGSIQFFREFSENL